VEALSVEISRRGIWPREEEKAPNVHYEGRRKAHFQAWRKDGWVERDTLIAIITIIPAGKSRDSHF